jgi:hypothetical protein
MATPRSCRRYYPSGEYLCEHYTCHGDTTNIGDEIVHYDEWVTRGH